MGTSNNGAIDLSLMDPIFERYRDQKGVLIPILQKTQDIYSYLPPEVLQLIADRLGVSLSKVYGVATFYSQFYLERRGKHILKLCDGTACHVKGTPILVRTVEEEYGAGPGETTKDGELTVEIVYCLGSCALAPLATLDDQVLGRMRPRTLKQRLKKHIASAKKESDD
jgi:NADH:ubiquinone oxidoreductase subunit E